jgi:hypothetical protein
MKKKSIKKYKKPIIKVKKINQTEFFSRSNYENGEYFLTRWFGSCCDPLLGGCQGMCWWQD